MSFFSDTRQIMIITDQISTSMSSKKYAEYKKPVQVEEIRHTIKSAPATRRAQQLAEQIPSRSNRFRVHRR